VSDGYRELATIEDAGEFFRWLSEQDRVAFDCETTGLDVYEPGFKIRLIQFGTRDTAWVIEFEKWQGLVEEVFRRFEGKWIAHNSRYDISCLKRYGIHVPWAKVDDTMIMMRLADPNGSAALKTASTIHVSAAAGRSQKDLHGAMKKQRWNWASVPIDFPPYRYYAAFDTVLTARLYDTDIAMQGRLSPVYETEMQVRAICSQMEENGMFIDAAYAASKADANRAEAEATKAAAMATYGISITSNQQLSRWFLSNGVPLTKATKAGAASVDADTLEELIADTTLPKDARDLAEIALRVRRIEKLTSAYYDNFLHMRDSNGFVHPDIETVQAKTGRMSIRNPALQTLPRVTSDPTTRDVRRCVVPVNEDYVILSCDYSQIELRLAAALSGCEPMMTAFRESDDFFTTSMQDVYGDPSITKKDPRRAAIKTYWYASLYGAGVAKLALSAGVPVADMQRIKDGVIAAYPELEAMKRDAEREARLNDGWVTNAYGRRLQVQHGLEYVATNYKLQSSAADVLKRALVNLGHAGLGDFMMVPVHDEVVMAVPRADAEEIKHLTADTMVCTDFPLVMPAVGDFGESWADAK
jgi:DNA polymerase-1